MATWTRKKNEQEQQSPVQSVVDEGRDYAKAADSALKNTKFNVVSQETVDPFKQTEQKTSGQLTQEFDAEMAGRDGMAQGMLQKTDRKRQISVDFSSIKDNEQAENFASTLYDEDTRERFLKDWAGYSGQNADEILYGAETRLGDRLFSSPRSTAGKNRLTIDGAMQTLSSGLMMDADGNDVDVNSASLPMLVQSIRTDPDSTSRKNKVKALQTLTQTEGSRFYGMTFDENLANTFLGGADWDDSAYSDTKNYSSLFYAGSGHEEENVKAYLETVNEIKDGNYGDAYSLRQQRSMRAALDKAYEQTTGYKAPTDEDIAAYAQTAQQNPTEEKGSSGIGAFFFGDKNKIEEKKKEQESAPSSPEASLSTLGVTREALSASTAAGTVFPSTTAGYGTNPAIVRQKKDEEETKGETPKTETAQEQSGYGTNPAIVRQKEETSADFNWFDESKEEENQKKADEEYARNASTTNERESVGTAAEAFALWRRGEALTDEEREMVESVLNTNGGQMIFNRGKAAATANADMIFNSIAANAKELYYPGLQASYGSKIQKALNVLDSGVLDEVTTENGYLALAQIINNADAWVESGIAISAGKNPYNVYINANMNDPERAAAAQALDDIIEAQNIQIESQKKQAEAAKQAQEEEKQARIDRIVNGTGTEEDVQWYYDNQLAIHYESIAMDETAAQFNENMNWVLNVKNGAYWQGDSAAATEGIEGKSQTDFRYSLNEKATEVLLEYANIASSLGKTTREYLQECGITDPNQIADIAYNRMIREGNEFLNSETAQTGLAVDNSPTIGVLPALGVGAAYGVVDTANQFASAPYNMIDAATYDKRRDSIMNQYNAQYGMSGRAVYRAQLLSYAESGEMSDNDKQALLNNIARADDIYDIAYEIDPNFVAKGYRAFLGALDSMSNGLYDYGMLGNDFERAVFSSAASISGSAAGMAISAGASALGAPPLVASGIAYGTTSWNRTYEEAVQNGMSQGSAAYLALGSGVISTLINTPGAEAESGMFSSGRSLLELQLAKQDSLKTATFLGKLKMYGKNAITYGPKQYLGEGLEEVAEDTLNDLWIASATPVFEKIENGQTPTVSDALAGISTLSPEELLKQGAQSFAGGFLAAAVFDLAGYAGLAMKRKMPGYNPRSVVIAQQMMDGTKDPTPENVAELTESLAQDLSQPEAKQAVDEAGKQAQDAQNAVAAAMSGAGEEQFRQGNEQMRMASEAQAKAEAAQQAADAAKAEFEELSDAVANGDLEKVQDMQAARVRMGENQKTANEYYDTAQKHKDAAQEAYNEGMDEARARGKEISETQNQQEGQRMQEELNQLAEIDTEIERLNQSYTEAQELGLDEDTLHEIERVQDELRKKRLEIVEPGREEAAQTIKRFEQALAESEELGLDEDTQNEIKHQLELAKAKERIYTQSESDWKLEEELYPTDTTPNPDVEVSTESSETETLISKNVRAEENVEVEVPDTKQARSLTQQEETYVSDDGRIGKVVESTTFEEQYAPEIQVVNQIVEAGRQAQEITQMIQEGRQVSQKRIDQVQKQMDTALSKLDDSTLDVFAAEVNDALQKTSKLTVETENAQNRDYAQAEKDWTQYEEARTKKQQAKTTYDALNDLASTLRKTPIYVDGQQAKEILYMTGMNALPQVNFKYGTNFRVTDDGGRIISLDRIYPDLVESARGYLEEGSYHPEEQIIKVMQMRKQARADMQAKIEKPQDKSQIRKAVSNVMEGDATSKDGNASYRGVEAQQANAKKKKGDNIAKVTKQLANDLGVGSTFGARNMNEAAGALGYYREVARYMATDAKSAGRVDVALHEIGHALSERLKMEGTPEMVKNLIAINPEFAQGYSEAQLPGEAMAEFMWRYMVSDEAAKAFAGDGFVATFERALEENGLDKAVNKAKNGVRNYLNQSVSEQVGSMVVNASDAKGDAKLDERFQEFIYNMVDNTAPAEKANELIRKATGEKVVPFEENLRESALLRNTADKRVYVQLNDALTDVQGTRIGDSLKQRVADAGIKGKDFDEFSRYWLIKHSLDRDAQGKPVFDKYALPAEQRQAYVEKMNRVHPEFEKGVEAIQSFRHDFMQTWMVDTGYMKQWQLDMFEEMYPNYAPTNRVKDNAPVQGNGKGNGRNFTIRTASGSTEQVVHPFDTFVENMQRIVRMNMDNQTALMFDRLYNTYDGFGILGRPIEQTAMEYSDAQTAKAQRSVEERLRNSSASEDAIASVLDGIAAERAHFEGAAGENNVITVQHADGSKTYYSITDPLFYKMMVNATDGGGKLLGTVGNLTRAMSALTTGSNPVFSARNFMRDFQNSVRYGTWSSNYIEGIYKWAKSLVAVIAKNADYQNYIAQGGGGWTRIDTGNAKSAAELRGMVFDNGKWRDNYSTYTLGGKGKWFGKTLAEFATLAPVNEAIEQASRFVEYQYGKHDLSTAVGRAEAFRAAQEVTVDFSRKGASGMAKDISAVVPFFNASLQGVYRTARQGTKQESGRAGVRLVKTVLNTGAALAVANGLCLKFLDDDDKEAFMYMSDDLKSKHMFFPNVFRIWDKSLPPLIRVPLDQDPVAYAVNGLMTNVMWNGQGDDWAIDFTASMATIADSLNPIGSTIFDPLIATQTNKNWYGSRIVPTYMDSWDATTQYTDETPEAFVTAGRLTGMSPMMLQYVFQQYTGFVGQIAIPAMSNASQSNIASATLNAYLSYAQSQITSNPLKSNDVISQMYDNSKFLKTVVKAGDNGKEMNMLRRDLTPRQAQRAYATAYDLTHSGGKLYECEKTISDGYERIEKINARDDLTNDEKYELTQKIRIDMCRAALKANEVYAQFDEAYVSGETLSSRMLKAAFGGVKNVQK